MLVTGAASDRFGRRLIMGISIAVEAGCALALFTLTVTGQFQPVYVFGVLGIFGIARAFLGPAAASLVVNLVPPDIFANAVSWNSSAWQLATILGPVAGGLLYGLSPLIAYSIAALLLIFSAGLIFSIPKPAQSLSGEKRSLQTMLAGFHYIWNEKTVLGAISLDLFAVLLGGAVALLPVYARGVLHLGPWGLGLLRSSPSALVTAVWPSGHPIRDHAGIVMFVFVGSWGLLTAIFGVSTICMAVDRGSGADGRSRHGRRLYPRNPAAIMDSGPCQGPGQCGQYGIRRCIQRAGGVPGLFGVVPAVVFGGIGSIAVAIGWAVMFPSGLRRAKHLRGRDD